MNIGYLKVQIEAFQKSLYLQELAKAIAGNTQGSKIHWN